MESETKSFNFFLSQRILGCSETILCDSIVVDICHFTFFQTHKEFSFLPENVVPRTPRMGQTVLGSRQLVNDLVNMWSRKRTGHRGGDAGEHGG